MLAIALSILSLGTGSSFLQEDPPPPPWANDDFIEGLEGEFNERLEEEFGEEKDFEPDGEDYIDFKPLDKFGDSPHEWNIGFSGKYKKGVLGGTRKIATQIGIQGVLAILEEVNADPMDPEYNEAVRELILDILRHEWEHTADPSGIFPQAPGGGAAPGGDACGHFAVKLSQLERICNRVKALADSATEEDSNCLPRTVLCGSYKVHRKALKADGQGKDCPELESSQESEEWWDAGPCEWCGSGNLNDCEDNGSSTVIVDEADSVNNNFGILPTSN